MYLEMYRSSLNSLQLFKSPVLISQKTSAFLYNQKLFFPIPGTHLLSGKAIGTCLLFFTLQDMQNK